LKLTSSMLKLESLPLLPHVTGRKDYQPGSSTGILGFNHFVISSIGADLNAAARARRDVLWFSVAVYPGRPKLRDATHLHCESPFDLSLFRREARTVSYAQ
jgi:hypothetical protein